MSSEKLKDTRQAKGQNSGHHFLILHNDDHNTIDFVINSLISVCGHESEQAEQCTLITHFKGTCKINEGMLKDLKPQCRELISLGLTVTII